MVCVEVREKKRWEARVSQKTWSEKREKEDEGERGEETLSMSVMERGREFLSQNVAGQ